MQKVQEWFKYQCYWY